MARMLTTIMSVVGEKEAAGMRTASNVGSAAADVSIVDILGEAQKRRLSLVTSSAEGSMMSSSNANGNNDSGIATDESEDVYTKLARKETDLILAAELGKALLEKNEELRRQNEVMAEGYQAKIEVG